MAVEEFQDRDDDYLKWIEERPTGYVLNVHHRRRGEAKLHSAACQWIRSRPPFTKSYIKLCSTALDELGRWIADHPHTVLSHCGTCEPPGLVNSNHLAPQLKATSLATVGTGQKAAFEWEIDGPHAGQQRVRLWADRYLPYGRRSRTDSQQAARDALRFGLQHLQAGAGEILAASYAGFKPSNMDVENLVLYNIDDTVGGCFTPATRHGVRFEIANALHGDAPSRRSYACSYEYGLTSPESCFNHWRLGRRLASFTQADLGQFPSAKRLEQVWLAIHHANVETAEVPIAAAEPFAVRLTLNYPQSKVVGANPLLVKALFDGAVAAFQCHRGEALIDEIAARLARATGKPANVLKQTLFNRSRAVLGVDRLIQIWRSGVQWNPADHLLVAAQVVCRPAPEAAWTLSGEIHAVERAS